MDFGEKMSCNQQMGDGVQGWGQTTEQERCGMATKSELVHIKRLDKLELKNRVEDMNMKEAKTIYDEIK
jgi:hypothetical protein